MGRKVLLTLALAVLGTALVAGVASASGGSALQTSSSGVGINLQGGQNLQPLGSLPECSNLKDDDGDGLTDLADPGCSGPLDNNDSNPARTTGTGGATGGAGTTGTTETTDSTGPSHSTRHDG